MVLGGRARLLTLFRHSRYPLMPHIDSAEFERLAREAISYYVGDHTRILGNLKVVLEGYHASGR